VKDLLEILKQASGLPTQTLIWFAVCAGAYIGYFAWKNHFSETNLLEKQKRKLEIIKLALEIEALRKQFPAVTSSFVSEPLENVLGTVPESKSGKIWETFKSFARHPLKWILKILTQRPKWLRYFVAGGLAALVFPLVVICYTLLHLPPNTSATTLHTVLTIQLGFLVVAVISGAIIGAVFNLRDMVLALVYGLGTGMAMFQLSASLFGLLLKLWAVFRNAQ
jgi:hypothetical protein